MTNIFQNLISTVYAANDSFIGEVKVPAGIPSEVAKTTDFVSVIIRFIVVIGGVFTLWQFLTGGLAFITSSGDKGKLTEAQHKIQMSLVGLVIMAASFIIIAIVSKILFGEFNAILAPKLQSI